MKTPFLLLSLLISSIVFSQAITDTGTKVGIGTTTPAHKLVVQGDSSPNVELKNSNYSNGGFILNRTNYGQQWKWWTEYNQMYFGYSTDESTYSNKLVIKSNGNVGIGTITPSNVQGWQNVLDVFGTNHSKIIATTSTSSVITGIYSHGSNWNGIVGRIGTESNHDLRLMAGYGLDQVTIKTSGNVGIGTTSPDSKLTVKGNIHTNEVKVDLLGAVAPDYVFYKDYNLKSLQAVEDYIVSNGHLPNVPSAKEMETDGILLKEMNLKLLEKIEELTLYAIEQEKKLENVELLEEEVQNQKIINENLEDRLHKIEDLLNSKK